MVSSVFFLWFNDVKKDLLSVKVIIVNDFRLIVRYLAHFHFLFFCFEKWRNRNETNRKSFTFIYRSSSCVISQNVFSHQEKMYEKYQNIKETTLVFN